MRGGERGVGLLHACLSLVRSPLGSSEFRRDLTSTQCAASAVGAVTAADALAACTLVAPAGALI